jgi:hypothetical protein
MSKLNPEVEIGDRIICLAMKGENDFMGEKGVVTGQNEMQIFVKWDNKGSSISMLKDEDKWLKEEDYHKKRKLKESSYNGVNELAEYSKVVKYFKMSEIKKYLDLLQKTSIINMLGASPYLYMGKDTLKRNHYNVDNEDFDVLVDMSDDIKGVMIRGAMNMIEDEGKEISVESVTRVLRRYAPKVLTFWMKHY